MIYIDATRRIAAVVLALTALAVIIGCAVIGAVWSPTVAAFIGGGITLGPALTLTLRAIESARLARVGRRIAVIGSDMPLPSSIPTAYRVGRTRGARS